MGVRSLLFRILYPLPQKGEDLLAHKAKFIEEYVVPCRLKLEIKDIFVPYKKRKTAYYAKTRHDEEQKSHVQAYRTWQKVAAIRQRD